MQRAQRAQRPGPRRPERPRQVPAALLTTIGHLKLRIEERRVKIAKQIDELAPTVPLAGTDIGGGTIAAPPAAAWHQFAQEDYEDVLTGLLSNELHAVEKLVERWDEVCANATKVYDNQYQGVLDEYDKRRQRATEGADEADEADEPELPDFVRAIDTEAALRAARLGQDERAVFEALYFDPADGPGRDALSELDAAERKFVVYERKIRALFCPAVGWPRMYVQTADLRDLLEGRFVENYGDKVRYENGIIDVSESVGRPSTAPFETLDAAMALSESDYETRADITLNVVERYGLALQRFEATKAVAELIEKASKLHELNALAELEEAKNSRTLETESKYALLAQQKSEEVALARLLAIDGSSEDVDRLDAIAAAEDPSELNNYATLYDGELERCLHLLQVAKSAYVGHARDELHILEFFGERAMCFSTGMVRAAARAMADWDRQGFPRLPRAKVMDMARRMREDSSYDRFNARDSDAALNGIVSKAALWTNDYSGEGCTAEIGADARAADTHRRLRVEENDNFPGGMPCVYPRLRWQHWGEQQAQAQPPARFDAFLCVDAVAAIMERKKRADAVRRVMAAASALL
jgi:hypothetical protein